MYRVLQLLDFAIIIGVFISLVRQSPSTKLTVPRAFVAGILVVGSSLVPQLFRTHRWHGFGPWFSLARESIGIGSGLLAVNGRSASCIGGERKCFAQIRIKKEAGMRALVIVCVVALCIAPAWAQHQHESGTTTALGHYPGLGNYHHPITTKNPEAQTYFNQGLMLLYGFNHDEAARYFRRAAELDPETAMPYWGLALSIGPNYNDAAVDENRARATYDAVQKAILRAPQASAREQDYIRALAKRYPTPSAQSDRKQFHLDYSSAMREVMKKYPDDPDAATIFAESLMMLRPWQLWTLDGKPARDTLELVAVLEAVLKRNPDNPGANHLYIHAVEASPNLERAIPSSMRLITLVPGAGHLVHMPGHIFLQTGDYELAAKTNVNAAAADKAFVQRTGATGMYPLMYWTHNLHFIAYARAQQGRYDEAKQAALEMIGNVGDADLEMQILEGFLLYPLMIDLRFYRWEEVLKTPEPRVERKLSRAFWQFARTMALAGQGKVNEAAAEQKQFELLRAALPAESQYLINNKSSDLLALTAAMLDAQLAWLRGEKGRSIHEWRRAVELESMLQYDEPPPWFYPVRESLARALLRNGQAKEAEAVFREAIGKHPRDGRLLFGLWQTLLVQKRDNEAALVEQQFRAAWTNATVKLNVEDL
jgi:tetratricopeptide (TPR) repeat protein